MIEKLFELKKPYPTALKRSTDFDRPPGLVARALVFLADALIFNGHSHCCVDSEIYGMTSRSHWLR